MSELRKDPINQRWVIIAPSRGRYPWRQSTLPDVDDERLNPFIAGHEVYTPAEIWSARAAGTAPNTPGWTVRVVPNRFPALRVESDLAPRGVGVFDQMAGLGAHEVVVETPEAGLDWPDFTPAQLGTVLQAWRDRLRDLRRDVRLRYHAIYRCQGQPAGAAYPHALSHIVGLPIIPPAIEQLLTTAYAHFEAKERSIFADVLDQELREGDRVVAQTQHFAALTPYASRQPFELVVYPLRQMHDFTLLTEEEMADLAELLILLTGKLRDALATPAYQVHLFTAPSTAPRPGRVTVWRTLELDFRWRLEILPFLQASVGIEAATGCYINPVAPEEAAAYLRDINGIAP